MKKIWAIAATAALSAALLLTGCGSDKSTPTSSNGNAKIIVGATPVPHAEILEEIKPILAKEGVDLEIKEFNDYNTPNAAVNEKEIDANFYQHQPYLDEWNAANNAHLVSVGGVHIEPMGIYSHTIKDLKNVPNGAKVAIPNDPSNGGRALLLLQKQGLITLKDGGSAKSTVADITANPKNLQFVELEAPQLPRSLDDVAIAVINTNFAIKAGLNPTKDAIAIEGNDSPYVNILVVRDGDQNRPEIQKLMKALQSPEVKKFIQDKYQGAILPAF